MQFKRIVKKAVLNQAFEYLMSEKSKLSKVQHIKYDALKMQDYMLPHKTSTSLAKFICQARCRMLDVKTNYKNRYKDLLCPLGCSENMEDTQQHLLVCEKLGDSSMVLKIPEYDEIFDQDVTQIVNVASILRSKLSTRQKMLNNVV